MVEEVRKLLLTSWFCQSCRQYKTDLIDCEFLRDYGRCLSCDHTLGEVESNYLSERNEDEEDRND